MEQAASTYEHVNFFHMYLLRKRRMRVAAVPPPAVTPFRSVCRPFHWPLRSFPLQTDDVPSSWSSYLAILCVVS